MKSLSEINFDYERAIREAERLESVAARLSGVADGSMDELFNALYRAWRSENASLYLRKGQKLQEDGQDIASRLKKTAKTIRRIAAEIRQTEMEARRIADEQSM